MPSAYSPLPDTPKLPDDELFPFKRDSGVQFPEWKQHPVDAWTLRRYLSHPTRRAAAVSTQLLRRILEREARRHSMWRNIPRRLKKNRLRSRPQDPDDPKSGSWGLDAQTKPREDEGKEAEGEVSSDSQSQKQKYLNMVRSKLLGEDAKKEVRPQSRPSVPKRRKSTIGPETAEPGSPLDDLYPFLDRKEAVSFFSRQATVSKRRRWLQKLIRMSKVYDAFDAEFDDEMFGEYEDETDGEDTVDGEEERDSFGDFDESEDNHEHSNEESNEDMSDSQESSSDSDEDDDFSSERLTDEVDDVSTESVDDRKKGLLAFLSRRLPARRTLARRLSQAQRFRVSPRKERWERRQQRLQQRRRQQANRRRKVKPTLGLPHVKRLLAARRLLASRGRLAARRLPDTPRPPSRRRVLPTRGHSKPATRKRPPARKLQNNKRKPLQKRLTPPTRSSLPRRRPSTRKPVTRWRRIGRGENRWGRFHSRHRGVARRQHWLGAKAEGLIKLHTCTTSGTTSTTNENNSTLITTPAARPQSSSPTRITNSDLSATANQNQTSMSPGKKTVFGETSRKPDWTVKPETSTSTSVTETTEELDLPVAQPDVQVGPDDTSDLSNKDGGPDKLSELEAVSTVYLGTVEGRRIQAARLDVLKPSAGHNVDDHNEQHAAPVYLRVQYKPASSENLDQAAGTVKRTRRDTSDDDDMDDNDNDDMDDDDDDDDNDDDNDDDDDMDDNDDDNDSDDDDNDDDDDDARLRNRRRRRQWRKRNRNQRREHDVDNVNNDDDDDDDDDDRDDVLSASERRRQARRRRRYRGHRRRERVRVENDDDEDDNDNNDRDDDDRSLGFVQIGSSSRSRRRGGGYFQRRNDPRRDHRWRNRNRNKRRNRRLRQQRRHMTREADNDDEPPKRGDDPRPYFPQIQTINNDNDNDDDSEAHVRSPFINHRTAYDFLSTQARSRPPGHASGRGHNEHQSEHWQFSHTMSEGLCEVFDKHFVPTSLGGRCE